MLDEGDGSPPKFASLTMPASNEISDILSELGLPAGAIALAVGLVRGARALEKDASEPALKYVSSLLIAGGIRSFGKLGATLVPAIFDRIFGPRPFRYKFISRSFVATTLFWLILLGAKHPNWSNVVPLGEARFIGVNYPYFYTGRLGGWKLILPVFICLWYIIDWASLVKARALMNVMITRQNYLLFLNLFVLLDVVTSYLLTAFVMIVNIVWLSYFYPPYGNITSEFMTFLLSYYSNYYLHLSPITGYLSETADHISLYDVLIPSTLLTSVWTLLVTMASIISLLLVPLDQLRRFTAWWFRDVEKRPLTALAKVAGTLIIIGAVVIKTVRWTVT
jgi:hypothetical protein